ncbi:hypothetical protein KMI8_34 [Klebsiella phage KMI8]|nr:hypothetical protein KMI8_34 [Klebsiella phage KMI8]
MEIVQSFEPEVMLQLLEDLYRGIVCRKLNERGLVPFMDCDPYEFATSLDMSFEEIMEHPLCNWDAIIDFDLDEYEKDILPNGTNC